MDSETQQMAEGNCRKKVVDNLLLSCCYVASPLLLAAGFCRKRGFINDLSDTSCGTAGSAASPR
jgi:hypothetical protein